ncbi:MAG: 2-oxoacid ferredoxin oxidoreductase [Spirochaetes bacterium]|nr:2-oxoacid ferredoxin oxidoreductase [Spirochaetota bacterium]
MNSVFDFKDTVDIAWCPGCGNFSILKALKLAINELNIAQDKLVMVSGIGQAAKTPQYIRANFFNGLHGRSLPAATGIKASNPELTVIAVSGDGCTYGEGGNHFIHTIRRNPDITNIVHNNMVYGLTKGQASPTSERGFKTPVQVTGVYLEPFNPMAVAVSLNASFVARAYAADIEQTKEIIKKAVNNRGYSLVDIFQPCVSFNKINTYQWYKENTYYLDNNHDPYDREKAMHLAFENNRFPLGIFYINNTNKTFEENLPAYKDNKLPLFQRSNIRKKIKEFLD